MQVSSRIVVVGDMRDLGVTFLFGSGELEVLAEKRSSVEGRVTQASTSQKSLSF